MGPRVTAPQRQSAWPPHIENRAEPKTVPPKPANSNVLGLWENGVFKFASPAAEKQWRRKSYEQGVSTDTWALGKEIDPQSAGMVQAGLAGTATPGLYVGPDGKYRLMNLKTIESQEARDHRNRHLTGKKIEQIEAAGSMPGTEEWVAQWKAAQARANDDVFEKTPAVQSSSGEATSTEVDRAPQATESKAAKDGEAGVGQMWAGRFGPMKGALNSADKQGADDIARIVTNSALGNYGDEVRASLGAIGAMWDGRSFGDAYDSALQKEKAESAAAQERQGLKGTAAEVVTGLIPFVGDVSGAVADFKDWKEHGDDWGWSDYGLVALGLVPGMPNRKTLKNGKKLASEIVDKVKSSTKGEGEELLGTADNARKGRIDEVSPDPASKNVEQVTFDPKLFFPKDESEIFTAKQVLNLPGEKVGLHWVVESEPNLPHAAAYELETPGQVWSQKHKRPAKPSLRYDNPEGDDLVKFDGLDPTPQANYLILIDSKTNVPPSFQAAEENAVYALQRQVNAVRQNNKVANGPKFKIRYDVPDESRAKAMVALIERAGYGGEVIVHVREASKAAQDKFRKLRQKE